MIPAQVTILQNNKIYYTVIIQSTEPQGVQVVVKLLNSVRYANCNVHVMNFGTHYLQIQY